MTSGPRIRLASAADPGSVPVMLLGGVAEDEDLWREVRQIMPSCSVCDARPSSGPEHSVRGAARAVALALSAPILAVGHSMGGLVALELAAQWPELVAGILLVCVGHPVEVNPRIYELLANDETAAYAALGVAAAGGRARLALPGPQRIAERFASMAARTEPLHVATDLLACETYQIDLSLLANQIPIAGLAGAEDRMLTLKSTGGLAAKLGARFDVIPDAGHQLPWEQPGLIAAACSQLRSEVLR